MARRDAAHGFAAHEFDGTARGLQVLQELCRIGLAARQLLQVEADRLGEAAEVDPQPARAAGKPAREQRRADVDRRGLEDLFDVQRT